MINKNIYNKKVLEYCPNYRKIMNSDFNEEDVITQRLLKIYSDYVFSIDLRNKDQIEQVTRIDRILYKYIDDYEFRGEIKKGLLEIKVRSDVQNILDYIIKKIIEVFDKYMESYTRNIYVPRWI